MVFSEAYIKTIKKFIPKTYNTYPDVDDYIFLYGNAMNEKEKSLQIRTSINKVSHYITTFLKLLKNIQVHEVLMNQS
jgi:hypothetical protein